MRTIKKSRLNSALILIFISLSLSVSAFNWFSSPHAVINDSRIESEDIYAYLYAIKAKKLLLKKEDIEQLLIQKAEMKDQVAEYIAFDRILSEQGSRKGSNPSWVKNQQFLYFKIYFDKKVKKHVKKAQCKYKKHAEKIWAANKADLQKPATFDFKFIYIHGHNRTAKKEIKECYEKASAGEDFGTLALQISEAKERDNVMLNVPLTKMKGTKKKVFEKLDTGNISRPFRTKKGYMIVKCIKKYSSQDESFEQRLKLMKNKGLVKPFAMQSIVDNEIDQLCLKYPLKYMELEDLGSLKQGTRIFLAECPLFSINFQDIDHEVFWQKWEDCESENRQDLLNSFVKSYYRMMLPAYVAREKGYGKRGFFKRCLEIHRNFLIAQKLLKKMDAGEIQPEGLPDYQENKENYMQVVLDAFGYERIEK